MYTWRNVRGGRPRAHLDDLRSPVASALAQQRQSLREPSAAGCGTAPTHASSHGLPNATSARRAAPAARRSPSQQAQQPDGSSAKRALRAAAPPVSGTAGHGHHTAAGRRRRNAGLSGAEPEK